MVPVGHSLMNPGLLWIIGGSGEISLKSYSKSKYESVGEKVHCPHVCPLTFHTLLQLHLMGFF